MKDKSYYFTNNETKNEFPKYNNCLFEVKNKSITTLLNKETKKINNGNKITDNTIIERKINLNNKIIINRKYYIFILIKYIILINAIYKIKCNILFNFQNSKITLKIKGIGWSNIFPKSRSNTFEGINYLKEVYINLNKQDSIDYKYYFNQTDNIVELEWYDNITDCKYMFIYCYNITEINMSNFNTSQVTTMENMFSHCSSLTSLDLSNLDTSQVNDMYGMFKNCSSLTSLNLSSFNTSLVTNMNQMFADCVNLEYINLNNFNDSKTGWIYSMFKSVQKNAVICLKELNTQSNIISKIRSDIRCYTIDCSDDWQSKQQKIVNNTNQCYKSCDESLIYPYEYNGKCFDNCSHGFLYDDNNKKMNKCKCELDECLLCPKEALKKGLCTKCSNDYYSIENDPLNIGEFIKCYKKPEGYYLNDKQCYYTCKECNISGNNITHNCIECDGKYPIEININNYINCFENCSYFYYFDDENNYHCTLNSSCPNEYPKLNQDKKECIKSDNKNFLENLYVYISNKKEIMSKEEEIKYYDNLIKIIEEGFQENYDASILDDGHYEVITTEKMKAVLTSLQNQKNNNYDDDIIIDLGICEDILRGYYNISDNESLYIKKIIVHQEGYRIPKVEYNIYSKLLGLNLTKLNVTICGNNKIKIYLPIELSENIDKLNSSGGYYNDICFKTTSEYGTDITLKDRRNIFIDTNMTVCQEECVFSKYDYKLLKVECSCKPKGTSSSIVNIKINKDKLMENFKDIKNILNFKFLFCYKLLFRKDGIINNIGCYIILGIILFYIITIFVFYINDYSLLKKKIKLLCFEMDESLIINKNEKVKKYAHKIKSNQISIYKKDKKDKYDKKRKIKNKSTNIKNIKTKIQKSSIKMISNVSKKIEKKKINKPLYIDEEINELSYNLSIQYDKRSFCLYYNSLIKTKHSLFFALCNNNDYNSKIIKIDLFFIGFTIEYILNALFYNDETMHKIYQSRGEFDLEAQLPIIAYSSLISMLLNTPLNFLSLTNDAIINFKQNTSKNNIMKKVKNLENKLNKKFVLFFIIGFIFLLFFWYYISMFCVVYRNTQIHLLKDSLLSFGFSLIIPFGYYILPGIFRLPALSNRKNKRKCLYNFSKCLQSF